MRAKKWNTEEMAFFFSPFSYLTTPPVLTLYSVGDRMINEYGAVSGMRIGRGNRSTSRKPALLMFYPFKSHMTWDRTRSVAVGRRPLTACSVGRNLG
jgi:hypothetical protein